MMSNFKISRLMLIILLVAGGVFFAVFVFASNEEEIKAHYQKGREYYEQGKYEQARKEFEKALLLEEELRKKEKEKEIKLELKEDEEKRLRKMIEEVSAPVGLSKAELIENHYREGVTFYRTKDYDKAIAEFEKVLTLDATHKRATRYLLRAQEAKLKQELAARIKVQRKAQEEARLKREAEERAKREAEERAKREAEEKARREAALRKKKQVTALKREASGEREKIEYIIGEGDILFISVWQWSDLREEVIVRPDGKISFPLVGDIQAAGLTLTELDKELTEKLSAYIRHPEVSVMLRKFGGRKVVILGEVKSPGVYRPTGRSSLLEAIALAGGFTNHAILRSIMVVRGDLQEPEVLRLDLAKAVKRGDTRDNIIVQPEDMIYVPKKFIANVNYFLDQVLGPISRSAYTVVAVETAGED